MSAQEHNFQNDLAYWKRSQNIFFKTEFWIKSTKLGITYRRDLYSLTFLRWFKTLLFDKTCNQMI